VDTGKEILTLRGHANAVTSVAWSPEGTQLASGSWDGTVKLWDTATGEPRLTLRGHKWGVWSVAWSPDGRQLASASADATGKVWNVATEEEPLTLRGHNSRVFSVAFSPDQGRLASASQDRTVKVWDAVTGKEILTLRGHAGVVTSVAWSPDGARLASASWDGAVKIWEAATGKETLTLRGHTNGVWSVAWSPDGRRLASASGDRTVKVWDAAAGKTILTLRGHTQSLFSVKWSPDGTRLASAGLDWNVKVWDVVTGREIRTLRGHAEQVLSVAWDKDSTRLASASWDGAVKVWDPATGKATLTLRGHTNAVGSVAWSPDGTRLASASRDSSVKIWDAASGKETLRFTLHGHPTDGVRSVAWSPDGTRLASASDDQTVRVYDATMGHVLERSPRLLPVLDRALAADPKNAKGRQLRADIHARRADWDRAAADIRQYLALRKDHRPWYTTDWWVVGPYPENPKESYPPENDPNPSQPVAGPAAQARAAPTLLPWQVVPRDGNGFVDFGALFDHAEHISAYALMRVYSPRKQRVVILLRSDGGVRLWLNGKRMHESPAGSIPEENAVPATLEAGWNTLLTRVAHVTGEHALYVRLSDEPADLAWASVCALMERGRRDEAERRMTEGVAKQLDNALTRARAEHLFRKLGDADARRGEWARVAADYAQLLKLRPDDHTLWYWAGTVLAELGDRPAYRKHCRAIVERFGMTKDPMIAERTAKVGLLLPPEAGELKRLAVLAERAVTNGEGRAELPYFHLARGLAEYRRGKLDTAARWLRKASAQSDYWNLAVPVHLIMAMIQKQRGKPREAKESLARAVALFEREAPRPGSPHYAQAWHDRLICGVLRREAEALIGGKKTGP
jgi:WD40 repeat protein/tetratricopeptide (TPR) repeat protein